MDTRPFRFGFSAGRIASGGELAQLARNAEGFGYDTFLLADHLGFPAPMLRAAFAAQATERIRIGTFVINNDFRHLALLALEAATLDVLSGGRFELGIGAGHIESEYDEAGIAFDPPGDRIDRMTEGVMALRRLFAGEEVTVSGEHYQLAGHALNPPPPQGAELPILIGGNGDRLLTAAARHADIVGFTGFSPSEGGARPEPTHFFSDGLDDRVALVRDAAGDRDPELNILLQEAVITDDRGAAAERIAERWSRPNMTAEQVLDSPFLLLGTVAEMADQLRERRERYGVSYWAVFPERAEGFEAVVAELAGT